MIATIDGKQVLVDQTGRALYLYTLDTTDKSTCKGGCATTWPPLIGPATAGAGVTQANLGTSRRNDGSQQVTYFSHPLYYFAGDPQPGQANGEGIGGSFFLVDAQGQAVK
jgi:predicted lipoprotein with Yx(FWY)xxD motif